MSPAGRILVVPAAGRGTRLASPVPKVLFRLNGRTLLQHVLDLYGAIVDRVVLVVSPDSAAEVQAHCDRLGASVSLVVQAHPRGMLDAILKAVPEIASSRTGAAWITWCDQVGIHADTVVRLRGACPSTSGCAMALPTACRTDPYVHFVRSPDGSIADVLQKREGDPMPERGESDAGLFALSAAACVEELPRFARVNRPGRLTGESNFLPFIPWLARQAKILTVPLADAMETVGINTPDDAARMAAYLRTRA